MKKLLAIILLLLAGVTGAIAQNANRRGFFVEAGGVSYWGERRLDATIGVDVSLGYRVRIANHWAYEGRIGFDSPFKEFDLCYDIYFLPVGFRYTSSELVGNQSIYAFADLGISGQQHRRGRGLTGVVGVGWNFSTHFYVGLKFMGQYLSEHPHPTWGNVGIRVGYRI